MRSPIVGPFEVSRSTNAADNQLVNLYPEIIDTRQGKATAVLYSTPGLSLLTTIGNGPIRGLHVMGGKTLFAVSGTGFYSLDQSFNATLIGTVPGSGAVKFIDNGTQIALFVGNVGFVWSQSAGVQPLTLPYSNSDQPISCAYQDGFGVINQPGSNLWFQSDLLDLATWNPLNFGSASADPDDVMAIAMIHRELWLIKQFETEVWYNAGTLGFTFARLEGVYMQGGIVAIGSLAQSNETLLWLAQTKTGVGIVVQSVGHALKRVSTHAVETAIQKATPAEMMAATAFTYQQQGHEFYVLTVADTTWCYDLTDSEKAGIPLWHQRASFGSVSGAAVKETVPQSVSSVQAGAFSQPPSQTVAPQILLHGTQYPQLLGASMDGGILVGAFSSPTLGTMRTPPCSPGLLTLNGAVPSLFAQFNNAAAFCCSRDGKTAAGWDTSPQGFSTNPVWWDVKANSESVNKQLYPIGNFDPSSYGAYIYGASEDGSVMVGSVANGGSGVTFGSVWLKTNAGITVKLLSAPLAQQEAQAFGIDRFSTTIVGQNGTTTIVPVYWSGVGGSYGAMQTLPQLPGTNQGSALRCDGGGIVIVGFCLTNVTPEKPCWWNKQAGTVHALSLTANGTTYASGKATDCSDDGQVIGGWVNDGTTTFPAVWTPGAGNTSLLTVLPVPAGQGAAVNCVSGDGAIVAGGVTTKPSNVIAGIVWRIFWPSSSSEPHRWPPNYGIFIDAEVSGFSNITVVGDFASGNLYKLDLDALTDNGQPRKWVRTWRALEKPVENPVSFHSLRIDMETGNAVIDPNTDPQVVLRWSDDGGHTWSNEHFTDAGKTGQTARRVMYRRLGATRRNTGLDRIFELSSSDTFPVAIVGAELDAG